MKSGNSHDSVRVKGKGNVVGSGNVIGDDNVVHSHVHNHQHHHKNGGGGSGGGQGGKGDPRGAMFALVFVCLLIAWQFARHAEDIYLYLKLGAIVCSLPAIGAVLVVLLRDESSDIPYIPAAVSLAIAVVAFFLTHIGHREFDPVVTKLSYEANDVFSFWRSLSEYGKNLVLGSAVGAAGIATAIMATFFLGLHSLFRSAFPWVADHGALARLLRPFSPGVSGTAAGLALSVSWLFQSGLFFELIGRAAH